MEWKKFFEQVILSRGQDYYRTGTVSGFRETETSYSAYVTGTKKYLVNIAFSGDVLKSMRCTCPYAEDGNYCKHMAAVLYYKEANNGDNASKEFNKHDFSMEIDDIISSYCYQGYLDYESAYDCAGELCSLIEMYGEELLKQGKVKEAFHLSIAVYDNFLSTSMDYNEGVDMVSEKCYDIWKQIADVSEEIKDEMFFRFLKLASSISLYNNDAAREFLDSEFCGKKYDEIKMQLVDDKLENAEKTNGYSVNRLLKEKFDLMRKLHRSQSDIDKLRQEYRQYKAAEHDLLNDLILNDNFDEAIILLKTLKKEKYRYGISEWECAEMLLELYELSGDKESYRSELYDYIVNSRGMFRDVLKLKNEYTAEEWNAQIENLCEQLKKKKPQLLPEIYVEEQYFDRLLQYVLSCYGLYDIKRYESYLLPLYEDRLLEKYISLLDEAAMYVGNRNQYRELVREMRRICNKYKNGQKAVGELVAKWRKMYYRRPAMMEELDKIII